MLIHYLGRVALGVMLLAACLLGILYLLQDKMILFPDTGGASGARLVRPGWGEKWIERGELLGRTYETGGAPRGTILVFHGNAGNIDHREPYAQVLTAMGYRVVLIEYPGYGERAGVATLNSVVNGSVDAFRAARLKWPGPLYLVGESLGAGVASQVAAQFADQIAGVLLFTPWDSLYRRANANFYGLPVGIVLREKMDNAAALKAYRGPVVIVGARQDTVIPVRHARALAAALPAASYTEIPDAGHNDWFAGVSDAAWDQWMARLAGR